MVVDEACDVRVVVAGRWYVFHNVCSLWWLSHIPIIIASSWITLELHGRGMGNTRDAAWVAVTIRYITRPARGCHEECATTLLWSSSSVCVLSCMFMLVLLCCLSPPDSFPLVPCTFRRLRWFSSLLNCRSDSVLPGLLGCLYWAHVLGIKDGGMTQHREQWSGLCTVDTLKTVWQYIGNIPAVSAQWNISQTVLQFLHSEV